MSLWSWVKQILLLLCKQAGGLQHNLNTLQHTEVHLNGWTTAEFWVLTPYSPERARRKVFHVRKTIKSITCKCLALRGMGEATLQGHGRNCRAAERASWFTQQVQKLESKRSLTPRTNISFTFSKCQKEARIFIQKSQLGTLPGTIITTLL